MDLVKGLGYVALTVGEIDRSLDFYRRVAHLKVSERGTKKAFLTGGVNHHWLRLEETGQPSLARLGFEVRDRAALDEIANRLDAHGIAWKPANDLAGDRVSDAIRFTDPDGFEIELFTDMVSLPVPMDTFLKMDRVLHSVWLTSDPTASGRFYGDVLGFKESDWIERAMVFMRAGNRYHHSIGIARDTNRLGQLDHFCILVDDMDDVMRARNVALRSGAKLRQDVVRHAASGSVSTYIIDPMNGVAVEFCTNHRQIDDAGYRARILPAQASTLDLWKHLPEDFVEPAEQPAERPAPQPAGQPAPAKEAAPGKGTEANWNRLNDG
ncbi:MAG TPA: VOC family protein [Mycobacteriales bacterium]|nr:VOC family protein [Mycobacteriales bacterium]